jgi:hypothetical protein
VAGRLATFDFSTTQYEVFDDIAAASPVPAGTRILYLGQNRIRLFDPASKRASELFAAQPDQTIGSLRLSPDGHTLYYSLVSTESDVWMVEIAKR